ncbi:hypothetical protein C2E23DRAFT_68319 [Lenzites betulinus]|nr:hypothetical protein C2E23DRAFT_68319 [Lenzites betulinus]
MQYGRISYKKTSLISTCSVPQLGHLRHTAPINSIAVIANPFVAPLKSPSPQVRSEYDHNAHISLTGENNTFGASQWSAGHALPSCFLKPKCAGKNKARGALRRTWAVGMFAIWQVRARSRQELQFPWDLAPLGVGIKWKAETIGLYHFTRAPIGKWLLREANRTRSRPTSRQLGGPLASNNSEVVPQVRHYSALAYRRSVPCQHADVQRTGQRHRRSEWSASRYRPAGVRHECTHLSELLLSFPTASDRSGIYGRGHAYTAAHRFLAWSDCAASESHKAPSDRSSLLELAWGPWPVTV